MKLSASIHHLKRQAKLVAKEKCIPLHAALDQIAQGEGYNSWSLLISRVGVISEPAKFAASLRPGNFVLLGARPAKGKTRFGLELAERNLELKRRAYFFTLEFHDKQVDTYLKQGDVERPFSCASLHVDTSDEICAEHIIDVTKEAVAGDMIVVDYMQILDQRRTSPPLQDQLTSLHAHTKDNGLVTVLISQIDRSFEQSGREVPELADVRLPNPVDLTLFNRHCFLTDEKVWWN